MKKNKKNVKGKINMFTVVDVIDIIANAKCEVKLDSFKYTKISKDTEQVGEISAYDKMRIANDIANAKNAVEVQKITDEASKIAYEKSHLNFVWNKNLYRINNVGYNETRPNVSISFNIDGKITLPSDAPASLPKEFETFVFRNFNIIHDGILNVSSMVVKMKNTIADFLRSEGVSLTPCGSDEYIVDFTNIPIFTTTKKAIKAMDTADIAYKVMENKSFIKIAKSFLEKLNPVDKSVDLTNKYGADESEYLRYLGITDNGFNPKSKEVSSSTTYKAIELLLKFKGMSNLPSYNAFMKKVNEGKKLNNADMLMKNAYDICNNNSVSMNQTDFINWLKLEIEKAEKANKKYAKMLSEIRFNILTCNQWFEEFENSTSNFINYNGIDVEFVKQEKEIEI